MKNNILLNSQSIKKSSNKQFLEEKVVIAKNANIKLNLK